MDFSPEDHQTILELAAAQLVREVRKEMDLTELVSVPLDAAAAFMGLSPKQAAKHLTTRQIGTRKKGVSLKALREYLERT